jgi:hypothetical protein
MRSLFLLLIDVFFLFVLVLNQLHPISIYIVYISVLLVVIYLIQLDVVFKQWLNP